MTAQLTTAEKIARLRRAITLGCGNHRSVPVDELECAVSAAEHAAEMQNSFTVIINKRAEELAAANARIAVLEAELGAERIAAILLIV